MLARLLLHLLTYDINSSSQTICPGSPALPWQGQCNAQQEALPTWPDLARWSRTLHLQQYVRTLRACPQDNVMEMVAESFAGIQCPRSSTRDDKQMCRQAHMCAAKLDSKATRRPS